MQRGWDMGAVAMILALLLPAYVQGASGGAQVEGLTWNSPARQLSVQLTAVTDWTLDLEGGGCRLLFPGAAGPAENWVASGLPGGERLIHGSTGDGAGYEIVIPDSNCRLERVSRLPAGLQLTFAAFRELDNPESDADDAYRIGVDDLLKVSVFGQDDMDRELRVDRRGFVEFPYVGPVEVKGLTVREAIQNIETLLAQDVIVDPHVTLGIQEYRSRWVTVTGQVHKPGRIYLDGPTTVSEAIALAEGLNPDAGTPIRVVHASQDGRKQVKEIGRDALYRGNDLFTSFLLHHRDNILVPSVAYFYIKGKVRNPGEYPISDVTTLLRAISLAGGLEEFANAKKIELLRQGENGTERFIFNMNKIHNRKAEDVRILPGDIINVPARFL